ncbi:MAG: hypothetical protein AAGA90_08740 [Actinomycetota bacterium]
MIDERLLLASALVHARPGGHLTAIDGHGRTAMIGRHPSADVDPCRWRATLIDVIEGRISHLLDGLELESIGGSLESSDSGGFVDRMEPGRRWFAVHLPPCLVVDTLRAVELGELPDDAVTATVRPDPELGVTVVGIGVDAPCMADGLERLALDVASALAVAELCATLPISGA